MPTIYSRTGLSRLRKRRKSRSSCLSASEFESAYLRERSRANRNLNSFSVITLSVERGGRSDGDLAGELVEQAIRCSDSYGCLDSRTLAILLPDTLGQGAWVAADRIQGLIAREELSVNADVFTHDFAPPADHNGAGYNGVERRGAQGVQLPEEKRPSRVARLDLANDDRPEPERVNGDAPAANGTNGEAGTNGAGTNGAGTKGAGPRPTPSPERVAMGRVARQAESISDIRRGIGMRPVGDLWSAACKPLSPWRRAVDVVAAGTGLVILSPVLLLAAIAVKLTSPGPALFVQKRAGIGGQPFSFVKFRSMYVDAEDRRKALESQNEKDGPIFKIKNDPRLTPVGKFLRQSSIDELPQLYNVLIGDMTLIGPRPPTLNEVEKYEPWQRDRLSVPGGLTCIWQVSGRSDVGFDEWVRMDLRYAQTRSPKLDFEVLTRTFKAVATGRGAY